MHTKKLLKEILKNSYIVGHTIYQTFWLVFIIILLQRLDIYFPYYVKVLSLSLFYFGNMYFYYLKIKKEEAFQ